MSVGSLISGRFVEFPLTFTDLQETAAYLASAPQPERFAPIGRLAWGNVDVPRLELQAALAASLRLQGVPAPVRQTLAEVGRGLADPNVDEELAEDPDGDEEEGETW